MRARSSVPKITSSARALVWIRETVWFESRSVRLFDVVPEAKAARDFDRLGLRVIAVEEVARADLVLSGPQSEQGVLSARGQQRDRCAVDGEVAHALAVVDEQEAVLGRAGIWFLGARSGPR